MTLVCGCRIDPKHGRECAEADNLLKAATTATKEGRLVDFWRNIADFYAHQGNESDQLKSENAYVIALNDAENLRRYPSTRTGEAGACHFDI